MVNSYTISLAHAVALRRVADDSIPPGRSRIETCEMRLDDPRH